MKNIVLIGFMGSGKSTIAKLLAEKLQYKAIEMDTLIIEKSGRISDTEIFDTDGEVRFRELEVHVAKELQDVTTSVISTGGGAVMNKLVIDYLKKNGIVVFLKNSFDTSQKRVNQHNLPPLFLNKEDAKKLYVLRLPLYTQYADIIIDTDGKEKGEVVEEIIKKIHI